jgi:hypothetical protein
MNKMAEGASFLIEFPCTVKIPDEMAICSVTFLSATYSLKCVIDQTAQTIKISTVEPLKLPLVPEGTKIDIKLSPITNPDTP